ncbi:MAG: DUF1232 domain-containing protein [Syntrophomonadaceae bacterium]|jgi:uncharacterized membrane protein YkvA (DUF1232 family)|nr:DUF1232 domain-containing protein [Syntrophomonadaceae bacterium]
MEWDFLKNKNEIKNIKAETIKEFFKQSPRWQKKAIKYINDPTEARSLLNEAVNKASLHQSGPLNDIWDSLQTLFSLIKDWITGDYRGIPFKALLLILAGIVYFVTPIDIIPDFIVGLGLLDDAVILGWIISQIGRELDDYRVWKTNGRVIDIEVSQVD